MEIYNQRPLKEIQAQREIEEKGTDKDALAHLLQITEANAELINGASTENTVILAGVLDEMTNAMAELTALIGSMMGGM